MQIIGGIGSLMSRVFEPHIFDFLNDCKISSQNRRRSVGTKSSRKFLRMKSLRMYSG